MKVFRPLIFIAIVFGSASAIHAQHFDWATGFGSPHEECIVMGMVTDADGNLYILGQFPHDASWEGHRLLPIAPYGPGFNSTDNLNTLIAKISPSGEMLWKKVIHSNNYQNNLPLDIKKVGDTAFACLVEMSMPSSDNYTYYLDTLLPTWSNYPVPAWGMDIKRCTAYILFDFDGDVKEQHFLHLTYTDTAGNDIVRYDNDEPDPWYWTSTYYLATFDVDAQGNIFISRVANDIRDSNYCAQDGTMCGIKFWVDRRLVGYCPIENRPLRWFPQLMKFSPHFDTLLASRYVVQKSDSVFNYIWFTRTKVDATGNVYYLHTHHIHEEQANTIFVDSLSDLVLFYHEREDEKGVVVRFDSLLNPQWIITLDDSVINPEKSKSRLYFHDITFDYDSNLLFILASTGRGTFSDTTTFCSILKYHGTPLDLKNDAFFMSFKNSDICPELYSYGRVDAYMNSNALSSSVGNTSVGNIVCNNNRVFFQHNFVGGVRSQDQNILLPNWYSNSTGLSIFNYKGDAISTIHYKTANPSTKPSSIFLQDSVLFVSMELYHDSANFSGIPISEQNNYFACIARYVDTSFMTPYVSPIVNQILEPNNETICIFPNPAHDILNINFKASPIVGASIISVTGVREPVLFNGTTCNVSHLLPGIYILEISTANNKYHQTFVKQ